MADAGSSPPPEATWTIVLENIGLVYSVVNSLCFNHQDRHDLVQEGMLGLFEAARRFDPSYGAAFSSYAYPYIRGYALRYFQNRPEEESNPANKNILALVGEEDHLSFEDGIGRGAESVLQSHEVEYIRQDLSRHLKEHLQSDLDGLERTVITLHWLADDRFTLREIAKVIGVTFQAVEHIENVAFAKLRQGLARRRK